MVIKDPKLYKKKEDEKQRLSVTDEENKEKLWSELKNESLGVITLAVMYAKNFEETGEDLTRRLINANQNADLLQKVYNKGYVEGMDKGRELERGKNKGSSNRNTSSRVNSQTRSSRF
jgi:hypothetical protein